MSLLKTDPLLAVCRLLSWFILIAVVCGALFSLCGAAAMLVNGDWTVRVLRTAYPLLLDDIVRVPFMWSMVLSAGALAIIARFMVHLLAIIRSVGGGEAFTLTNAARIGSMAWLSLAGMPVGFCMNAALSRTVTLLGSRAEDAGIRIAEIDAGFSYSQLLLTLLLFVLARLFAQAATMRDEIEGTV